MKTILIEVRIPSDGPCEAVVLGHKLSKVPPRSGRTPAEALRNLAKRVESDPTTQLLPSTQLPCFSRG